MARLKAYPRKRATDDPVVAAALSLDDWRKPPPPDDREKIVAAERMWHRASGRLAYRACAEVPVEELPGLVGDTELQATNRGEPAEPIVKRGRRSR